MSKAKNYLIGIGILLLIAAEIVLLVMLDVPHID